MDNTLEKFRKTGKVMLSENDIPNFEKRVSKVKEQIIDLPYHAMCAVLSKAQSDLSANLYYREHIQEKH